MFGTQISKRRAIGVLRAERKLKGLPGLMSTGYAQAAIDADLRRLLPRRNEFEALLRSAAFRIPGPPGQPGAAGKPGVTRIKSKGRGICIMTADDQLVSGAEFCNKTRK